MPNIRRDQLLNNQSIVVQTAEQRLSRGELHRHFLEQPLRYKGKCALDGNIKSSKFYTHAKNVQVPQPPWFLTPVTAR